MHSTLAPPRKLRLGSSRALKGAALIVALLEAIAAQAKPEAEGLRLNARNTPVPGGDAYETGRGLLAAGDVTGAMAAFREALLDAPQSIDTLNAIAVCYDRIGRYDISRSYYDAAMAIAPDSVLVLNNLGYSLYLQGDLRGAIPLLQQAAAAGDPQASATSRRLLQLISVKLREGEARASMAQAVAELKSPGARVELAANGESRLVLAAPAPRPELVASLGDAAALTVAPKVWTARDEKQLEAGEAARQRAETAAILTEVAALTAADAALRAAPAATIDLASAKAATSVTKAFPLAAPETAPTAIAAALPVAGRPAIAFTPAAMTVPTSPGRAPRQAEASISLASATPARKSGRAKAAVAPVQTAAAAAPVRSGQVITNGYSALALGLDAPGWIVASRRSAPPSNVPRLVGQSPDVSAAVAGFDSDDPVLNAFAARMQRPVNDNRAPDVTAEVAISRLEALIARLRRA
jgi:Tfp pilus assembly protein PilF